MKTNDISGETMFCYEKSICDYEYLYTIPGTIGGNIFMNAGCYGFEIKDQIPLRKIEFKLENYSTYPQIFLKKEEQK